jgi:hypothetical protein
LHNKRRKRRMRRRLLPEFRRPHRRPEPKRRRTKRMRRRRGRGRGRRLEGTRLIPTRGVSSDTSSHHK